MHGVTLERTSAGSTRLPPMVECSPQSPRTLDGHQSYICKRSDDRPALATDCAPRSLFSTTGEHHPHARIQPTNKLLLGQQGSIAAEMATAPDPTTPSAAARGPLLTTSAA